MRVTLNSAVRDAQAQLPRVEEQIAQRTRELSSGRRLNKLSDDPSSSVGAVINRAESGQTDSYIRATDSVGARLSIVDSLLNDVIVQITGGLTAAFGARGSAVQQSQRDARAIELEGIRDTILADVNTQFNGAYLFSGGASTTEPYTKTAGVVSPYQGTATDVSVDIGEGTSVQVSRSGDVLLRGSDADDLFVELDRLIAGVRAGMRPTSMRGSALSTAHSTGRPPCRVRSGSICERHPISGCSWALERSSSARRCRDMRMRTSPRRSPTCRWQK